MNKYCQCINNISTATHILSSISRVVYYQNVFAKFETPYLYLFLSFLIQDCNLWYIMSILSMCRVQKVNTIGLKPVLGQSTYINATMCQYITKVGCTGRNAGYVPC